MYTSLLHYLSISIYEFRLTFVQVHDKVLHGFDATIKAINSIDTPKQIGWRRKYHDIIRGILGLPGK